MILSDAESRHATHYLQIANNICAVHAGPDLKNIDIAFSYAKKAISIYVPLLTALQAHQAVGDHVERCPRCGDGASCVEYNGLAQKAIDLMKSALAQIEKTQ